MPRPSRLPARRGGFAPIPALVGAALLGCGADVAIPAAQAEGGGGAASGSGGAGGANGVGGSGGATYVGSVGLSPGGGSAEFRKLDGGACSLVWEGGGCVLLACPGPSSSDPPSFLDAGELRARVAGKDFFFIRQESGVYELPAELPWAPGTTLTVAATGADSPAFEAEIDVPEPADFTEPSWLAAPDPDEFPAVDASSPLPVTWTPAPGQRALVVFGSAISNEQPDWYVGTCAFDGAAGEGTVPAEVLSGIPGGDASVGAWIGRRSSVDAGGEPGTLRLSLSATSAEKLAFVALE